MITLGADPEMFFSVEGQVLPAGVIFDKHYIEHTLVTPSGSLYVDGAALELQPLPDPTPAQLTKNIKELLVLAQMLFGDLAEIIIEPQVPFDLKWAKRDKQLAVFGCDPDKSAWGEKRALDKIDVPNHPWRYAGAHIHFGLPSPPNEVEAVRIIRGLDYTVGLISVVVSGDRDLRRRAIYGRPGIYRIQPHGIEYRTPSNLILGNPELYRFTLEVGKMAVEKALGGFKFDKIFPSYLLWEVLTANKPESAEELYDLTGFPPIPKDRSGGIGRWVEVE